MPKRHGLNTALEFPTIHFGINEICESVGGFPFNPTTNFFPSALGLFAQHFNRTVEQRIFYSLHSLQININKHSENWDGTMRSISDKVQRDNREYYSYQAAISVESLFFYWGMLLDDLARVIIYAVEKEPNLKSIFGIPKLEDVRFSRLKTKILEDGIYPILHSLFIDLDLENSWWKLGFDHSRGFRHRFTHYTDSFSLNGGGTPHVWQFNEEGVKIDADFDYLVVGTFTQFCNWLDKLEEFLRQFLRKRAADAGIVWHEKSECHKFKMYLKIQDVDKELKLFPRITS